MYSGRKVACRQLSIIYLSLGSNISPKLQYLRFGINSLKEHGIAIKKISSAYLTSPMERTRQPNFLNAVAIGKTKLDPLSVLRLFKKIEKEAGRGEGPRFGPRTLDIDLLLYDELQLKTRALTLPHPRMFKRKFVLVPLLEIDPRAETPDEISLKHLLKKLDASQTVKLYRKNWVNGDCPQAKTILRKGTVPIYGNSVEALSS